MKVGLIELEVDISQRTADDAGAAIRETLRANPASRMTTALAALDAARDEKCDLIVMPGYTVVSRHPPQEIIDRSQGCTIVFECLWPRRKDADKRVDRPWWSFVAKNGRLIVAGARQWFSSSADVAPAGTLSPEANQLLRELREATPRRWRVGGHKCTLLICGEVNLARGSLVNGRRQCRLPKGAPVGTKRRVRGDGRVVINPAHTWSTLTWMASKRAWLSEDGWTLHTANTHTSYLRKTVKAGVAQTVNGRAWSSAAAAWKNGVTHPLTLAAKTQDFSVHTLTIP